MATIAGIVAEYNPFHNGHAWHIDVLRRAGANFIVVVMSGHYVQRGEPALLPKDVRGCAAVASGVDLVLELPSPYALRSAQGFAKAAVSLLLDFGVNLLSFGCETPNLPLLMDTAKILSEKAWFPIAKAHLNAGEPFATARAKAVNTLGGADMEKVLSSPNNLLAVEYLCVLLSRNLRNATGERVKVLPVQRIGAAHDSQRVSFSAKDISISAHCQNSFSQIGLASASHLRQLALTEGISAIAPFVPPTAMAFYLKCWRDRAGCAFSHSLDTAALALLRRLTPTDLGQLPDCGEGLAFRFYREIAQASSLVDLQHRVKTKRYPMSRIRRICWNAILGFSHQLTILPPPYLRILAMGQGGGQLLSLAQPHLPLSHSLKKLSTINHRCAQLACQESAASDLYGLAFPKPLPRGFDYTLRLHRSSHHLP